MKITVKLHGILRDYRPQGLKVDQFEIDVDEAAVVRYAAEYFGIPPKSVHAVFVNGEDASLETPLHSGDHVRLFPPVVGGSDRTGSKPWRVFVGGIMQGSRRTLIAMAHTAGQADAAVVFVPEPAWAPRWKCGKPIGAENQSLPSRVWYIIGLSAV